MGLNSALVDRARVINKRAAGRVVDGTTIYGETEGEWFRCRLELGRETETLDPATSERSVHRTPSLMVALRDLAGDPVELNVEQRLEIESRELGNQLWDVLSAPEPMRKKRKVIGWQATLRRVEQHVNAGQGV